MRRFVTADRFYDTGFFASTDGGEGRPLAEDFSVVTRMDGVYSPTT
ncbi:MAG: hypothetical protein KDK08_28840 [Rhizobiaceae bacterium]|nr:hypothetical protein [Rhizobiaceae bacterium]